jgi:hypothetical protein
MSEAEWNSLRPGDIVVESRSKTPRMVLGVTVRKFKQGPRLGQPKLILTLRKIRRSWTPCEMTVLLPSDWRHRLLYTGRRAQVTWLQRRCKRHPNNYHFRKDRCAP